jgi:hypothetical protein
MTRPYTGFDGISRRRRPGLEMFVSEIQTITGGRLWNNGTLVIRSVQGGTSPSIHGTGRAADLSHRPMGDSRRGTSRSDALDLVNLLIVNADAAELEMLIDYHGTPRVWRCDRESWLPNRQVRGVADSFHIELSPAMADDAERARAAARQIFTTEPPAPPRYPGRPSETWISRRIGGTNPNPSRSSRLLHGPDRRLIRTDHRHRCPPFSA